MYFDFGGKVLEHLFLTVLRQKVWARVRIYRTSMGCGGTLTSQIPWASSARGHEQTCDTIGSVSFAECMTPCLRKLNSKPPAFTPTFESFIGFVLSNKGQLVDGLVLFLSNQMLGGSAACARYGRAVV